ncbi:MAG: SRPBCC family protein [Rhodospirillales bacterium]|nr:SRPBCC family protein [Rhodospirillales bacterium]
MTKVHMSTLLNVPAGEVWDLIGRWNTLPEWHPAVLKSELSEDGQIRRLTLAGGGVLEERLEQADERRRTYTYEIVSGPLTVSNYKATVSVRDEGSAAAAVEWSSDFEAHGTSEEEASDIIRRIYRDGLDNLKRMFGAP